MKLVLLGIVCFGLAMEVSAINMPTGTRLQTVNLVASIINQIQQWIISFVQRLVAPFLSHLPSLNQPSNPTDYDSEDDSSTSGTSSSIGLGANEISGNKGNVEALNRFGNSASGTNGNKFNFKDVEIKNNKGPVRTFTDVGNTKGGANPSTNGVGKKGLKLKEPSSNRASTPTGRVTTYTDASGRTVKNINFEGQTVSGQVGTNVGYSGIGNDYD
uniref:Uncharacterized protein n=1 Tax=Cacopsylla melanoneura TaxID=428564 RepID=A0A8D8S9F6_9HEMI